MRSAVIQFPGTNRECDMVAALTLVSGRAPSVVWHKDNELPSVDLVVLPGGFSYGDYLRSGAIAAHSTIIQAVRRHANRGGLVLGVCNGFQILCEADFLPGTLVHNRLGRFICQLQGVRVERINTPFTQGYPEGAFVHFPIAHQEGFFQAHDDTIKKLEGEGQVVFRYCDGEGRVNDQGNPNGSINHIAGIINDKANVMGLMPHPENVTDADLGEVDGLALFKSIVESLS